MNPRKADLNHESSLRGSRVLIRASASRETPEVMSVSGRPLGSVAPIHTGEGQQMGNKALSGVRTGPGQNSYQTIGGFLGR
jgi:hypothetical protein